MLMGAVLPNTSFIDWIFWAWERLLMSRGGYDQFRRTPLVLPTEEDFPVDLRLQGEDLVDDYFLFVKEHARVQEWPLVAVAAEGEADAERGAEDNVLELFVDRDMVVGYEPELLETPTRLVAQLARGTAHYAVHSAFDDTVGDDEVEPLTDVATVFIGFGVFAANAASSGTREDRWAPWRLRANSIGTLMEHELAYALALFTVLNEIPDRRVEAHLQPNPREFYRKAVKHVLRHRARGLERLRGIPLAWAGPYR